MNLWVNKIEHPDFLTVGLPGGSDNKESTWNVGDLDSVPGLGRSPGGGHGNRLQYSYLGNPMHKGACRSTVCGAQKGQTIPSD